MPENTVSSSPAALGHGHLGIELNLNLGLGLRRGRRSRGDRRVAPIAGVAGLELDDLFA